MSNFYERENTHLKNALGFLLPENSEVEIYNDFIKHFAAGDGTEEDLGGDTANRNVNTPPPGQGNPDNMSDQEQNAENILATPDNQPADIRDEWTQFVVELDTDMSDKLQNEQHLSPEDADDKSSYIKYTDSKTGKTYGIQGPMFGVNREQGIGENIIGGYKSKIEAEKDLDKMQETWKEGFPMERDYLIVEKNELSPALQAYQKRKEDELPNLVEDQHEEADEADKKDETDDTALAEEALGSPATPEAGAAQPISKTKPQPATPKPLGKVHAFIMNTKMKRESRLQALKSIKGK